MLSDDQGAVLRLAGSDRLVASAAPVLAAVDGLASFVVVDTDHPSAHSTLDPPGQQVPSAASPNETETICGVPVSGPAKKGALFATGSS